VSDLKQTAQVAVLMETAFREFSISAGIGDSMSWGSRPTWQSSSACVRSKVGCNQAGLELIGPVSVAFVFVDHYSYPAIATAFCKIVFNLSTGVRGLE
jgi:hypothetical protein